MFRSYARLSTTLTLHSLTIPWKKPFITHSIMESYLQTAKAHGIKNIIIDNKHLEKTSPYIYLETIEQCKKHFDNIILTVSEHDYGYLTPQENNIIFANYKKAGITAVHLPKNWITNTDNIYSQKTSIIDVVQEQQIQLWMNCVLQMSGINSIHTFNQYLDWVVKMKIENVLVKQMHIYPPKQSVYKISDTHINSMTSDYVPIEWLIKHYVKHPYNTTYIAHTLKHNNKIIQILFENIPNQTWVLCTNGIMYSDITNIHSKICNI
jgi:hypothetical protein